MARRPAEERDPPTALDPEVAEETVTRPVLRRIVERARQAARRSVATVCRLLGFDTSRPATSTDADRHRTGDTSVASDVVVPVGGEDTGTQDAELVPGPEARLAPTAADATDGRPDEPVAHVDGDEMRVELPGRPRTRITSDVWVRVER